MLCFDTVRQGVWPRFFFFVQLGQGSMEAFALVPSRVPPFPADWCCGAVLVFSQTPSPYGTRDSITIDGRVVADKRYTPSCNGNAKKDVQVNTKITGESR